MEKAARKASRHFARDFGEVENLQVSRKGPADFVSAADLKAERILREELLKARPNHGFLGEEGEEVKTQDGGRWIVDPLDGTSNFIHGLPHFAVSIALERDGALAAGAVYQPLTDELFWAAKGAGAFLNNRRLRVSSRKSMADSLFATGIPFLGRGDHPRFLRQLDAVMGVSAGVRRFGAAALDLVYVAAGKFDGFWESGLAPWDIAAGALIAQEAGALVTDFGGGGDWLTSGDIVAAPPALHEGLRAIAADA
ncbi:MAG: inositol monophosphatase family protein [Pseudomonadota bacterium]